MLSLMPSLKEGEINTKFNKTFIWQNLQDRISLSYAKFLISNYRKTIILVVLDRR